ncbi:MAG TPA: hypothetical protein VNS46_21645 [Nocardioides sp.]|nr:hypothetical protein [Nocardioides sp.]
MTESSMTGRRGSQPVDEHPKWCTAHNGMSDDSSDWHQSADISTEHHDVFLSDGTLDGAVAVFIYETEPFDGAITLDEAEALGTALLRLVEEARA